jgi:hypothetical protein
LISTCGNTRRSRQPRTLSQKGLDQTAVWTTIAPFDGKSLPNGHKGNDRVKEKRRNLHKCLSQVCHVVREFTHEKPYKKMDIDAGKKNVLLTE